MGLAGCRLAGGSGGLGSARLTVRPGPLTSTVTSGLLALKDGLDGYLLVPASYDRTHPLPLMLALHGAGGDAMEPVRRLGVLAENHGFLLLGVKSRGDTWDGMHGGYGPDVAHIDQSLQFVFGRCAVDPARLVVEGFSDGASYALGLGRANGDLFTHIVAFSPGFIPMSRTPDHGRPDIFISHGKRDSILPINATSRRIVPGLEDAGYEVTYREFDGEHEVPEEIALAAVRWLVRPTEPVPQPKPPGSRLPAAVPRRSGGS